MASPDVDGSGRALEARDVDEQVSHMSGSSRPGDAHSPMAMAAFSGGTSRTVGAHLLRLVAAEDGLPAMLVISPNDADVADIAAYLATVPPAKSPDTIAALKDLKPTP